MCIDYVQLCVLVVVICEGSFDCVVQLLNVMFLVILQWVKVLEDWIGCLLVKCGILVIVIVEGQLLVQLVEQIVLFEYDVLYWMGLVDEDLFQVSILVVVNYDSLEIWFLQVVYQFVQIIGIILDLCVEDQDYIVELLCQGMVLGVVIMLDELVQGCQIYVLGSICYVVICMLEFCECYFVKGVIVQVLVQVLVLVFNCKDEMQLCFVWCMVGDDLFSIVLIWWIFFIWVFVQVNFGGMGWIMNFLLLVKCYLDVG